MGRFVNPFTDWGFKRIFGQNISKDVLLGFLNSLFEGEHIFTSLTFLNNEQTAPEQDGRTIIYDVYCTTDKGEHIIVEMQNRNKGNFIDRTLYYMANAIHAQGQRGADWNYKLDAVYGIFLMNFSLDELGRDRLRTDIVLADKDTGRQVNGKMRMVYLQLPCFDKQENECESLLDCWIYTLSNMTILERMPFLAKNAVFAKLAEIGDVSSMSKEEHQQYDSSIKAFRDRIAEHEASVNEGVMKVARTMLQAQMPIEQVATYTGMDIASLALLQTK